MYAEQKELNNGRLTASQWVNRSFYTLIQREQKQSGRGWKACQSSGSDGKTAMIRRKGILAVVLLIILIIVLRSSTSSAQATSKSGHAQQDQDQNENSAHRIPPQGRALGSKHQVTMDDLSDKPLRDRLRYQFPYDLEGKFPAYIWQTWKVTPASGDFSEELRPYEASWTELHPGFVHEVVTDSAAENLIRYLYGAIPEVIEAYQAMPLPILKADFFRYLILLARGGIYTDIDTLALKSATEWLPDSMDRLSVGLIVGIEADVISEGRPDWYEWYSRPIQLCQWTIQAKPGHPVLRDVVANITEEALRMKRKGILTESRMDKTIVEFTGPAVWTDAIFRYLNDPQYFNFSDKDHPNVTYNDLAGLKEQKKIGDVAILPITSFSPGVGQMGAEDAEHPLAFVLHSFGGKPRSLLLL